VEEEKEEWEREREREILLTIKKCLEEVGKHNALSGITAPGRRRRGGGYQDITCRW
jgi:hypothetical protein